MLRFLCLISVYIWCLNSIFLCDNGATRVSLASCFLFFLKSVIEMCVVCFCFWVGVQSVSGSFCMHISGIVSYDCKNESSSHQLKYFIFTDRAVLWLSLRVISDVSHSVTLLSSMKNIFLFFFFFYSWKLHPRYWTWKRATCSITLSDFLTAWVGAETCRFPHSHSQANL